MITVEQIKDEVRHQAAMTPDYVYADSEGYTPAGCKYVPTDDIERGCIVGEALMALGVPSSKLDVKFSVERLLDILEEVDYSKYNDYRNNRTDLTWLEIAQSYQDRGRSWQQSVSSADIDCQSSLFV